MVAGRPLEALYGDPERRFSSDPPVLASSGAKLRA
jgi:hypothetical protein